MIQVGAPGEQCDYFNLEESIDKKDSEKKLKGEQEDNKKSGVSWGGIVLNSI